ncbi:bifunctional 5,10-methylenetetrahydrofolate dehydrogenase/5,10-methenyltetrahydrofolate cyclohydrolase [bacterium]|nr:bifunctional 5,10-methylenetetrahydrofolate dehydrogenase/5,10-methenyltetrahydrofolate cyclohydrolase [bacterium]
MRTFNGKKEAERIIFDLKKKIKKEKIVPRLAVILVGENKASKLFIRKKKEAAKIVGIKVKLFKYKRSVSQKKIIEKIEKLNLDPSVNGILVQLPLPEGFDTDKIIGKINPKKDVDGFLSVKSLKKGKPYFFPVLPSAILFALRGAKKSYQKKRILALVNSGIFGQTLKNFLERKKIKINYLIKKNYSLSEIEKKLKLADVIIVACGQPNLIEGKMIKKGAILIDGGITLTKKGKLVGDVARESVKEKASFLTPVPGGLGPLTVSLLLRNVYFAQKIQKKEK